MTGEEKLRNIEAADDGWVEWPSFPENENKFDWSLSLSDIERKYQNDPDAGFSPSQGHNTKKKRANWFKKRRSDNLFQRKEEEKKANYVNYNGEECPCIGFIDRAYSRTGVAGVRQYQNAYYHSGEEKYLFQVNGGILAYPKELVGKYIKPFFPGAADVHLSVNTNVAKVISIKKEESIDDVVKRLLSDPEPNFHIDA